MKTINMEGGSFLGVSRGCPPLKDIVDRLEVLVIYNYVPQSPISAL